MRAREVFAALTDANEAVERSLTKKFSDRCQWFDLIADDFEYCQQWNSNEGASGSP
jgi:hypothetical protein